MYYGGIRAHDVANGLGVRVTLFVSGCPHQCKGCFNEETWDYQYGKPFTDAEIEEIVEDLKKPEIQGLTLLGGEPLAPPNRPVVCQVLRRVKADVWEKDIWCYTGYLYETLCKDPDPCLEEILSYVDVLVDGPFVLEKKSLMLKFRGSANQRIIDVRKTRQRGEVVLVDLESQGGGKP